jgi:hypothetical protein
MARAIHHVRPTLESLEARETPAGIVNVTFAAGSVAIVGDNANNGIGITTQGGPQLTISATDGDTTFRLNGAPSVAEVTLPTAITGNMIIRTGEGNDSLTFRNVNVPGSLAIFGGNGNNSILVRDTLDVGKNLSVINGTGYDQITIETQVGGGGSGRFEVDGIMTVRNQSGGSSFLSKLGTSLTIGHLFLLNGDGFDQTELLGEVNVAGKFAILNGPGGSRIEDGPGTDVTVGGALSIVNGAGEDNIALESMYRLKAGSISILNGAGQSTTAIAASNLQSVARNLVVVGGADHDSVSVGVNSMPLSVGGTVLFSLGSGGSNVDLLGSKLTIGGSIRVLAANGTDSVEIHSAQDGPVAGGVAVGLGAGENQSATLYGLSIVGNLLISTADLTPESGQDDISLFWVNVGLRTIISTGASVDVIAIVGGTFDGSFSLSTGAGNDSVGIGAIYASGETRFNSVVVVRTGDGNDVVMVGHSIPELGSSGWGDFAAASYWIGGPGDLDVKTFSPLNEFKGPAATFTGFEA